MKELSIDAAVAQLQAALQPIDQHESVALGAALGRVLAAPVVAQVDLPAFDNSAMDGYALRAVDLAVPLRALGTSYAGHAAIAQVAPGTCVRIMTGAPLPRGADTVVMLEDVQLDGDRVQVLRSPEPGANIRRRGEHVRCGETVIAPGRRLGPAEIGLAAGVGQARVSVMRRLLVGIASTGDELADPPAALEAAASYDANRPLLVATAQRLGFEAHDVGICPDDGGAFEALLARAFELRLDVLLVSGGAAQGDADIVRQAGGIHFLPLDIRPGRGLAFAQLRRDGRHLALLGLPGNAVAAFVMFHLVAKPTLLHLAGARAARPPRLQLPLAHPTTARGGRIDYRRARIIEIEQRAAVELLAEQGSAMLRTVVEADALAAIGPAASLSAGTLVEVLPLELSIGG